MYYCIVIIILKKMYNIFQDVKAFSGDDFDAKEWINKAFKQPEALQNKEQFAQSLVMKLQLLIAKMNANLEDQSEQILQNMPRILREVESLQQESALLRKGHSLHWNKFSESIFWLLRPYYNHIWKFFLHGQEKKVHFCPQHAVQCALQGDSNFLE